MLSVFIIEPQPQLSHALRHEPQVRVMGCVNTLDVRRTGAHASDFVLVSARFPLAALNRFLQDAHAFKQHLVIVDIDECAKTIVPLLEAGASGYVRRGATVNEMVAALHAIAEGKPTFAPNVGTALVTRMRELLDLQQQRRQEWLAQNGANLTTLTDREREILLHIRNGASNQEIAERLTIELGTVKNHVHNILKKLNVTRRADAAQYVGSLES